MLDRVVQYSPAIEFVFSLMPKNELEGLACNDWSPNDCGTFKMVSKGGGRNLDAELHLCEGMYPLCSAEQSWAQRCWKQDEVYIHICLPLTESPRASQAIATGKGNLENHWIQQYMARRISSPNTRRDALLETTSVFVIRDLEPLFSADCHCRSADLLRNTRRCRCLVFSVVIKKRLPENTMVTRLSKLHHCHSDTRQDIQSEPVQDMAAKSARTKQA